MYREKRMTRHTKVLVIAAKEYIDNHANDYKSTTELAGLVGISRNALQAGFKALFKIGIKAYYDARCIERAKNMLDEGSTIKAVAFSCRYKSASAFSTAFKKHTGMSPREWQERPETSNGHEPS
jgi:AraC-like DNA-binding protein